MIRWRRWLLAMQQQAALRNAVAIYHQRVGRVYLPLREESSRFFAMSLDDSTLTSRALIAGCESVAKLSTGARCQKIAGRYKYSRDHFSSQSTILTTETRRPLTIISAIANITT